MNNWTKLPSGALINTENLIYANPLGLKNLKLIWVSKNVEILEYNNQSEMLEDFKFLEKLFIGNGGQSMICD